MYFHNSYFYEECTSVSQDEKQAEILYVVIAKVIRTGQEIEIIEPI